MRHAWFAILAACCGSGSGGPAGKTTMFEPAWTRRGDTPANSGALRYATLHPDALILDGSVLEPTSGAIRWNASPAVALGIHDGAVIVVREEADKLVAIERRDPKTGAVSATVPFLGSDGQPKPLRGTEARLDLAGEWVVYAYLGRASVHSSKDGRLGWGHDVGGTESSVVVSGELLGVIDRGEVVAYDVASGVERWRAPSEPGDVIASPRGGFFVPRGDRTIELDASGKEVRMLRGRVSAADGDFVAVIAGRDIALVDGAGTELDRVSPQGADDYVSAGGLCSRALVYFRSKDSTVWWHPLNGTESAVVKVEPKSGMTDRGPSTAGATLTEPPRCVSGFVLVQDWFVSAYRIPT